MELLKIKRLHEDAVIPRYATPDSAGFDLHAIETDGLEPGQHKIIPTGIAMKIPQGHVGLLFPRSGNAVKFGINLKTGVSVIDADYIGEVGIPLHNESNDVVVVNKGDRIAQMVVMPYEKMFFKEVEHLPVTTRNAGGFGSSGQ